MSKVNAATCPDFIGEIIGIFEDYAADVDIKISNEERDDEINSFLEDAEEAISREELEEELCFANIYGDDYDAMMDAFAYYMDIDSDPSNAVLKDEESAAKDIIDTFYRIIIERGKYADGTDVLITEDMSTYFFSKIEDVINRWEAKD